MSQTPPSSTSFAPNNIPNLLEDHEHKIRVGNPEQNNHHHPNHYVTDPEYGQHVHPPDGLYDQYYPVHHQHLPHHHRQLLATIS